MINKSIKLSDFIKIKPKPFICGAFLSRIMYWEENDKEYFYAYSSFKSSKYVYPDDFDFIAYSEQYRIQLDFRSGYHNWVVHKVNDSSMELRFYIEKDIDNFSSGHLYEYVYKQVMSSDWCIDEEQNDKKKDFIRGFIELRGSVDTKLKFISQDYFYDKRREIKKGQILTDQMNIPISYANFNARNLQPDYVSGKNKRNTQFRINLYYYAQTIGFINPYKALVFENAYNIHSRTEKDGIIYFNTELPKIRNHEVKFIEYLNFFTNNIYEKELTPEFVKELRKQIGFENGVSEKERRSAEVINVFKKISPDECAICGTKNTFTTKKGDDYFEIHHVISWHNGPEYDNISNLVKLCPTCHRMMGKGSAKKEEQINAIKKILSNHEEIYDFAVNMLGNEDIDRLSETIQSMLG